MINLSLYINTRQEKHGITIAQLIGENDKGYLVTTFKNKQRTSASCTKYYLKLLEKKLLFYGRHY